MRLVSVRFERAGRWQVCEREAACGVRSRSVPRQDSIDVDWETPAGCVGPAHLGVRNRSASIVDDLAGDCHAREEQRCECGGEHRVRVKLESIPPSKDAVGHIHRATIMGGNLTVSLASFKS